MEEDIKVLENYLEDLELMNAYFKDEEDINIKQSVENLIAKNKELEKENIIIKTAKEEVEELLENSIPISKIQEKIADLKRFIYTGEKAPQDFLQYKVKAKIQVLEELLEE